MPLARFLPALLISAFTAFFVTPLILRLAKRVGFVDEPSARKIHLAPVPLLGGVAIYLALLAGGLSLNEPQTYRELAAIFGGATLLVLLGAVDDKLGMHPLVKLGGQLLAGLGLKAVGIQVHLLGEPWDTLLTLVWVAGIGNAMNFMDNMDGLAAGVAAIASGWFLALSAGEGQALVGTLAAALLGATGGFLFYNRAPASIFMGDAGSLVLGFLLAALGIKLRFIDHPLASTWSIPILVLGLLILDTTLVVFSRLRGHRPVWLGGTDHLSHRLVARGMDRRRAVWVMYGLALLAGAAGFVVSRSQPVAASVVLGVAVVAGMGMIGWWEFRRQ